MFFGASQFLTKIRQCLLLCTLAVIFPSVATATSVVRIHYHLDPGQRLTLRGSAPPLSWSVGISGKAIDANTWEFSLPDSYVGEVKPLVDDQVYAVGSNFRVKSAATTEVFPYFRPGKGKLVIIPNFQSPELKNTRTIRVYLPPSYGEPGAVGKKYPVIYAHDGQNLFEDSTAFQGNSWHLGDTLDDQIGKGLQQEVIVVGIDNTPERIHEMTPDTNPSHPESGGADTYLDFIFKTVKPYIDSRFRTLPGRESTSMLGSSLGGLVTLHAGLTRPQDLSKSLALSPSLWWNGESLTQRIQGLPSKPTVSIYLDAGVVPENADGLDEARRARTALLAKGYQEGADLYYDEEPGATHSEDSWGARVFRPLIVAAPPSGTSAETGACLARVQSMFQSLLLQGK